MSGPSVRSLLIAGLGSFCAGHLAEAAWPVLSNPFSTAAGVTALVLSLTAPRARRRHTTAQTQEPS